MENLWPQFKLVKIETPKAILEEQAKLLSKLTGDIVYASVDRSIDKVALKNDFSYDFSIKGKFLDNYKFRMFTIYHNVEIYPLIIKIDQDIRDELHLDKNSYSYDIDNEEEFKTILKRIFQSKKIAKVLQSIISLSN